jgi:hypothetical protein
MYKVSKKYMRGPEQVLAQFKEVADAKEFVKIKLEQDAGMKVQASYLLYEGSDLLETLDAGSTGVDSSGSGTSTGTGSAKTGTLAFSPTPFQVTPKPGGLPPSSFRDLEDDKKK